MTATTVRVAAALVFEPAEFVATTVYVPASAAVTLLKDRVEFVAPTTGSPFLFHWSVGTGEPATRTFKLTDAPTLAD